jgi:hypothetical protein
VAFSMRFVAAIRRVAMIHDGRRAQDESGQVIVIVAVMMTLFLLCAAVVVNIGSWYDADSGLQKAADLSAVAGAQYLATGGSLGTANPSYPCTAAATAADCATTVAALNGVEPPNVSATQTGQAIEVTTQADEPGIFVSSTRRASATAVVASLSGATNTFPATFRAEDWVSGQHVSWPWANGPQPRTFNMLDTCGGVRRSILRRCFRCTQTFTYDPLAGLTPVANAQSGCENEQLCVGEDKSGADPGSRLQSTSVVAAINSLADQIVLVPVYSSASGSGFSAVYTLAGFAAIRLDNPVVAQGNLNGRFVTAVAPAAINGSCGDTGGDFGVTTYSLAA